MVLDIQLIYIWNGWFYTYNLYREWMVLHAQFIHREWMVLHIKLIYIGNGWFYNVN